MELGLALGLLAVRFGLGFAIAAHGAQKVFGWFGGHGVAGTGAFFEQFGFRPGRLFAVAAGASELIGGLLIVIGLFGAVGPALIVATMIVAALSVHAKNGFFAMANGYELAFLYSIGAVAIAFAGFGTFSLDQALGLTVLTQPPVVWSLLVVATLGALANLGLRRAPAAASQAPS